MQHGMRHRPRSQAAQQFFALFYRLNTRPTARTNVCRRAISSTPARSHGEQELFPSHLKGTGRDKSKTRTTKGKASVKQENVSAFRRIEHMSSTAQDAEKRQPRDNRSKKAESASAHQIDGRPEVRMNEYIRHIYSRTPDRSEVEEQWKGRLTKAQEKPTVSPDQELSSEPEVSLDANGTLAQERDLPAEDTSAEWGTQNADISGGVPIDPPYRLVDAVETISPRRAKLDALRNKINTPEAESSQDTVTKPVNDSTSVAVKGGLAATLDKPEHKEYLRRLMRYMPSPVVVITTCAPEYDNTTDKTSQLRSKPWRVRPSHHADPHYRAMAVSSFTTVSMSEQPIISFNVKTPSRTLDGLRHWSQFYVHVLHGTLEAVGIASAFTRGNATAGFRDVARNARIQHPFPQVPGAPDLPVAPRLDHDCIVAVLVSKILKVVTVADHEVVFATVRMVDRGRNWRGNKAGDAAQGFEGLLYHDRQYKRVGDALLSSEGEKVGETKQQGSTSQEVKST